MPSDPNRDLHDSIDAFEIFERHKAKLIADARKALAADPRFDPVGLIVDGDAPGTAVLAAAFAKASGRPVPAGSLVGIAPRGWLIQVLAAESEEPEDWVLALMDEEPGKLLVAALSARGARIAAYPLHDDDRRGLASP